MSEPTNHHPAPWTWDEYDDLRDADGQPVVIAEDIPDCGLAPFATSCLARALVLAAPLMYQALVAWREFKDHCLKGWDMDLMFDCEWQEESQRLHLRAKDMCAAALDQVENLEALPETGPGAPHDL